jgi:hypothetical protein
MVAEAVGVSLTVGVFVAVSVDDGVAVLVIVAVEVRLAVAVVDGVNVNEAVGVCDSTRIPCNAAAVWTAGSLLDPNGTCTAVTVGVGLAVGVSVM